MRRDRRRLVSGLAPRCRALIALGLVFWLTTAQTAPADSVFWQAYALEMGSGGTRDVAGAIRLYEQAAQQRHGPSMVRLGYMKQLGAEMPQDLPGAFALYRQAADTGDVEGQFMYALALEQGIGTQKNPALSRERLVDPAHAGHQLAQYLLGCMIAIGEGGPKREAGARRWLDKAASGSDRDVAARAARYRDQIDKNLFTANSSGFAYLGLAAFIIVGGMAADDGSYSGGSGGGAPSGGMPRSGGGVSPAPGRPTTTFQNGPIYRTPHGTELLGQGRPIRIR
jgi:TPR repeat protein